MYVLTIYAELQHVWHPFGRASGALGYNKKAYAEILLT